MSSMTRLERPFPIKIDSGGRAWPVAFSANGEHLLSTDTGKVRVWRVEDGKEIASVDARGVQCFAVSKDGRWIAAGTYTRVIVWDTKAYRQTFAFAENDDSVRGVDFSPDSTHLVIASSVATVWEFASKTLVGHHFFFHLGEPSESGLVRAAKYSLEGDQIATATWKSVRIYDSKDGNLLVNLDVGVNPWYNTSLAWSRQHLFIVSDYYIHQVDPCAEYTISEWPVPASSNHACIALAPHEDFIAYSTNHTVSFWATESTHTRLGLIQLSHKTCSVAFSPNNQSLAVGGEDGNITINTVRDVLDPSYGIAPFIDIEDDVLDFWKQGELAEAEASLTGMIRNCRNPSHRLLATRALVRAHLKLWDLSLDDAEKSIGIQPSVIGYIAKSVALIGSGEKGHVCQVYDFAFMHCHPSSVQHLLLIKAVILFMVGEHSDATSRVSALISTVDNSSVYHVVQAYMSLLSGIAKVESDDYEEALLLFQRASVQMQIHTSRLLPVISLISGWSFHDFSVTIQRRLCETLYVMGHIKEAVDSFHEFVNAWEDKASMSKPIVEWVSDFTRRCLIGSESDNDGGANRSEEATAPQGPVNPLSHIPLLSLWAKTILAKNLWKDALNIASSFAVPKFTVYRVICECLETIDRATDAIDCLKKMVSELADDSDMYDEESKWILGFMRRCAEKLVRFGDMAADAQRHDDAVTQYSAALSLNPPVPQDILVKRGRVYMARGLWQDALGDFNQVLMRDASSPRDHERVLWEWVRVKLTGVGWKEVLNSTLNFKVSRFAVYQSLCEQLVDIMEALACVRELVNEPSQALQDEQLQWIVDFKYRCCMTLGDYGDAAVSARQYGTAISQYSTALTLHPTNPQALFAKRNRARAALGLWSDALEDANEVIKLDPSSLLGYEMKHAALRALGRYDDACEALKTILSKMLESPDPEIRKRCREYVHPSQVKAAIRAAIENVIREIPLVLINTNSGHLVNKSGQASAFEKQPIFGELISSFTVDIDHARIEREVAQYYRYAMFSHKWEEHEPLFEDVIHAAVYALEESRTHNKLKMFCKIVRDTGFYWAWSDTCCINKADHFVLQEALVAMFKWYAGSAMTVVLLLGVRSPSRRGDLVKSIWNMRAWTLQEYHASKVVRFYNEDWMPYRNLDIYNHKESREIILEMEEVTGISSQALMGLQPGLDDIRAKLRLASTRQTTRIEDSAYSLLGIFSASLPIVYGEGDKALGRLLAQLLTSSGDTSILAWTGTSGSFNSCIPTNIVAFRQSPRAYIPTAIQGAEMDMVTAGLRTSSIDFTLVMELYDRLCDLPVPSFAGQRMRLPCIAFKLGPAMASWTRSGRVFRAQTAVLGIVEIGTEEDITLLGSLYLIHPWIDFLLDRQPVGSTWTAPEDNPLFSIPELPTPSGPFGNTSTMTGPWQLQAGLAHRASLASRRSAAYSPSLRPPSTVLHIEKETEALQTIIRLRQPFGALLLAPKPGNVSAFRRVVAESLITVRVQEVTPAILSKLVESVRILDVL